MLSIEEYIAKRKEEEKIDEFDVTSRQDNLKQCVDFVFDYFNSYLGACGETGIDALKCGKSDRYRDRFLNYEDRVLEWLEDYYAE